MSSKKLIIFDLDGTLIQSKIDYEGLRAAIRKLLKNILPDDKYNSIENNPLTILELVNLVKAYDSADDSYEQAWIIVENFEKKGYEKAIINNDVLPTLEELKSRNYGIAVLTNNSRNLAEYGLKKFNLSDYIQMMITRDDVQNAKPNTEGLEKIMKHFKKEKQETIFIGDSWLDAETALLAGVEFCYFGEIGSPGTRRKIVRADHIISKLDEIFDIV